VAITKPPTMARRLGTIAGVAMIAIALYLGIRDRNGKAPETVGPSLAVLPFENVQGDSAAAYFSDGITEEIIGTVSRLPSLHVVSRSVSFRHRGRDIDVKKVGAALGVSHLLEGSVQQVAKRVRVSVRLTDVRTGFNSWSERYDRDLTDIFAVEDEIAAKVAGALNVTLVAGAGKPAGATAGATTNAEAHDAYLLGLAARNRRELRAAATQFAKAIKLDSNYASAYSGLASVLVLFREYGLTAKPDSAVAASKKAAERALAIDQSQAAAHVALAYGAKVHGRDYPSAEALYKKALALDANDAQAHHWYGELLMELKKFDEARGEFTKSMQLDASSPASTAMLAMVMLRNPATIDSGAALCRKTEELSPPGGIFPLEFACGAALTRAKRFDEAHPYLERAGATSGAQTAFVIFQAGVANPAKRLESVAAVDRESARMDPILIAVWYLLLGEKEKTRAGLARAEKVGSPFGSFLEVLDFSALNR
jgi:TolB-like protein/tetratricopeptide (TPR) repeat protein